MKQHIRSLLDRPAALVAGALLGVVTAVAAQPQRVDAADHIDFPDSMLERNGGEGVEQAADISDLFAWTPEAGRLALVLNVFPHFAGDGATPQFSDAVTYQFRVRPAAVDGDRGYDRATPDDQEAVIKCHVDAPNITCDTPGGRVSAKLDEAHDDRKATGARLFAGLRADPFYLDLIGITTTFVSQQNMLPQDEPVNFSDHANVLSIVLDVDLAQTLGIKAEHVAVTAETARRGS